MNENPTLSQFLTGLVRIWFAERISQLAAGLAYFGIFSLAPIVYIAFTVAGLFIDATFLMERGLSRLKTALGTDVADVIRDLVEALNQTTSAGSALLSVVSSLTLLYAASRFFVQLKFALNRIWRVPPPKRGQVQAFIIRRMLSFLMVLVLGLVLVTVAILNLIGAWLDSMLDIEILDTRLFVPAFVLVNTMVFALLYKVLPEVRVPWRSVWLAAGIASLLITLGGTLVVWLLGSGRIGSGLTAAGAYAVILLLIYYATQIFLFGAILSREYSRWHERRYGPRHA